MDLAPRSLARFALLGLLLVACGDARAADDRELLARFPKGKIFHDLESPPTRNRGLPECLRLLAPAIGHGVCVPLDDAPTEGGRPAPRWGRWTYEYVATTQTTSSDGKPLTHFTEVADSSLGLEAQGEYANDELVGEWTFWHPNGNQRAVGSFADGKMSGEWSFWLADGSPDATLGGTYENGTRIPAPR